MDGYPMKFRFSHAVKTFCAHVDFSLDDIEGNTEESEIVSKLVTDLASNFLTISESKSRYPSVIELVALEPVKVAENTYVDTEKMKIFEFQKEQLDGFISKFTRNNYNMPSDIGRLLSFEIREYLNLAEKQAA